VSSQRDHGEEYWERVGLGGWVEAAAAAHSNVGAAVLNGNDLLAWGLAPAIKQAFAKQFVSGRTKRL